MFIEDSSLLEVMTGNLWVYGSVVGQDRGLIRVHNGSIITVQVCMLHEDFNAVFCVIVIHANYYWNRYSYNSIRVTLSGSFFPG